MNATYRELRNVFQAAADLQREPREIRDAARTLGIEPASRYTGLALYSAEQLDRIDKHLSATEDK
jgi:hypothetical protein